MIGLLIISFYKYVDIRLYFILGGLILGGMLILHGTGVVRTKDEKV